MGKDIEVEIQGLSELQDALEALPDKVGNKICKQALTEGAKVVQTNIKATCPTNTGLLADEIKYTVRKQRGEDLAFTAKIGPTNKVIHGNRTASLIARWLEFGTYKMAKRPFMTAGWEVAKSYVLYAMGLVFIEKLPGVVSDTAGALTDLRSAGKAASGDDNE